MHRFVFLRSEFETLASKPYFVSNDISSFAEVACGGLPGGVDSLRITFSWLSTNGETLIGKRERVLLPRDSFMRFVSDSAYDAGITEWGALSLIETNSPKIIFNSHRSLRQVLDNETVKRKLVSFLSRNFHWFGCERIVFTDGFEPYSFFFQSYSPEGEGFCGGLILHRQEDMANAYYSVHT